MQIRLPGIVVIYMQVRMKKYLSRDLHVHGVCTEPKDREHTYTPTHSY
jgi:hypothetical protein